jgi:hypothetical protein
MNVAGGMKAVERLRRRVCEGLTIGFGSGLNVPFYPEEVTRVAAVEPADLAWNLAQERLRAASVPVARSGLDGQILPFADDSYDTALSTWTLCTVPDADAALRELLGGCHLTRPIVDLLTTAGFAITERDVFYEKGSPKFEGADSLGSAVSG